MSQARRVNKRRRTSTHQCAIPGCNHEIPRDKLMCRAHWFLVPQWLRIRVLITWNDGLGVEDPDYLRHRQQAIDEVLALSPGGAQEATG